MQSMKAKSSIKCACREDGFERYDVVVTVPIRHSFGWKGIADGGVEIDKTVSNIDKDKWEMFFHRRRLGDAMDDCDKLVNYLDGI